MTGTSRASDIETALENCAAEPVHIPGVIQDSGTLIAARAEDGIITHAAANAHAVLGLHAQDLLGAEVSDQLGRDIWHSVRNMMAAAASKRMPLGSWGEGEYRSEVFGFVSGDRVVLEFEPPEPELLNVSEFHLRYTRLIERIRRADTDEDLMQRSVDMLRRLTGFDRVKAYRFDSEYNGEVIAESRRPQIESYMGLRFPHSDIPKQAREIMTQLPLRCIFDRDAEPVPLLSLAENPHDDPLDITQAILRGTSPVHAQYLENMGVRATMTISLVMDGQLWGILAFHHLSGRVPSAAIRSICEAAVPFIETRLALNMKNDELEISERFDDLREAFAAKFVATSNLADIVPTLVDPLLDVFNAHGLSCAIDGQTHSFGQTPSAAVAGALYAAAELDPSKCITTDCLAEYLPDISEQDAAISGALTIKTDAGNAYSLHRVGLLQTVHWAGKPEKDLVYEDDGNVHLSPRSSFVKYAEQMRGRSVPWTQRDVELLKRLVATIENSIDRHLLVDSQKRQQELIVGELNHRVRNILALIRSVSRQTGKHYASLESYRDALEQRIASLAAAHDIAVGTKADALSLRRVIEVEAEPFVAEAPERVKIRGDDAFLKADKAPLVALVIHELMTNAAKYGALHSSNGMIDVELTTGDGLKIDWVEIGGPAVVQPERMGFGTNLIENAIRHEFGGTAELLFLESGVKASLHLPVELLEAADTPTSYMGVQPHDVPSVVSIAPTQKTVLIVEDQFLIAEDMCHTLSTIDDWHVEVVSNEKDALTIIDAGDVGAAFLDVNLGVSGTDSFGLAMRLEELGIPFIFVTGYGGGIDVPDALKHIEVHSKPVRENVLLSAVVRMLGQE